MDVRSPTREIAKAATILDERRRLARREPAEVLNPAALRQRLGITEPQGPDVADRRGAASVAVRKISAPWERGSLDEDDDDQAGEEGHDVEDARDHVTDQAEVSKFEKRTDLLLSTLKGYVEAAGGRLEIVARFPDARPVRIDRLGDVGRSKNTRRPDEPGAFLVYVDKVLGPTLKPSDIVIMDSLPAHKGDKVKALIEARDARLMVLPPYSPDLNPIELAFSKFKALLRKAAERTVPALWHRIGDTLKAFTPQECSNYFRHDGYAST